MAITQSKKQSDLEKRLRLLRQQVYGRSSEHSSSEHSENSDNQSVSESESQNIRYSGSLIHRPSEYSVLRQQSEFSGNKSFRSDITYLRQDLLKIFILASSALGIQFILFYLLQNHILNLNFL